MTANLDAYTAKRDFTRTREPAGRTQQAENAAFFVIQKHAARRLHYDFRLAHDGVLKSWAVPKGLSDDPQDKRLAVQTEDHPLAYAAFQGTIPKGEYGAGTVEIWDRGAYSVEGDFTENYRKGHLRLKLEGERSVGDYDLFRIRSGEEKNQWIIQKRVGKRPQRTSRTRPRSTGLPSGTSVPLPLGIKPQLATLVERPPAGDNWWYEIKWDGYRLMATYDGEKRRLLTRNGHDWTERFPAIVEELERLPVSSCILDGEAVMLDSKGHCDFQALQNALRSNRTASGVRYVLFDLLFIDGVDLRNSPLSLRHDTLRKLINELKGQGILRLSERFRGHVSEILRVVCHHELEGVVAKQADAPYRGGRQPSWKKLKCTRRQEFIAVGFTPEKGSRNRVAALLLATWEKSGLRYRGKVSTSINEADQKSLRRALESHLRPDAPPALSTKPGDKSITWLDGNLVVEVAYQQLTGDGILRHAVFKGIRHDKAPHQVQLEIPEPPPSEETKSAPSHSRKPETVEVMGITISNPDREIDTGSGATKADLARYYSRVGQRAMPYFRERPLSLVRCPQGLHSACFFQKHLDETPPHTRAVELTEKEGKRPYSYVIDPAGLVACAQMGTIEFHGWGSRQDDPGRPDQLVMDLDPSEEVRWAEVLGAAFILRDMLAGVGLKSWPKLTGGKGIHVCVPLVRRTNWDEAKTFCRKLAEALVQRNPKRFIAKSSKDARRGKIFVDYLRNGYGATAVLPFSVRARPRLPVVVPLGWDMLDPTIRSDHWTLFSLPQHLAEHPEDPWKEYHSCRQSLTKSRLTAFD